MLPGLLLPLKPLLWPHSITCGHITQKSSVMGLGALLSFPLKKDSPRPEGSAQKQW